MIRCFVVLVLFTLIAAGSYRILPPKTLDWLPANRVAAHKYDDTLVGGRSIVRWLDTKALKIQCDIQPLLTGDSPFCGMHVHLDNNLAKTKDLSKYHHVEIEAEYKGGNKKLRFYMREFVPGFTDPKDPVGSHTAKYMGVYVDAAETQAPFTVSMNEFVVAEWWLNDLDVPRKYSLPSRERVLIFGVDISHPTAPGEHEFTLKRVTFVGDWISAEHWYLGLLILWLVSLLVLGVARYYLLRRYTTRLDKEKCAYQRLSMIDSLTGLMNRYGFTTYYEEKVKNNQCLGESCLLLLDIDHFKLVNDNCGHPAGDAVLRNVGSSITSHLRNSDLAARWGGEEFLVLLPATELQKAEKLAERLRDVLATICYTSTGDLTITVSIGVCQFNAGESLETCFLRADKALYQAKHKGRDQVAVACE